MKTVEKLGSCKSIETLQKDNGLHFEQLKESKNRKTLVYSARVDQGYRVIMLRGRNKGNPYCICFVGKHDEANSWASRHDLVINPRTGGLQLLICPETTATSSKLPKGPLVKIRPVHWHRLGLASDFIPQVQSFSRIGDEEILDGLIPPETLEAIQYLLVDCPLEEVLNTYGLPDDYDKDHPGLFDGIIHEDMLDLGIPESYLEKIYDLRSEKELEKLQEEIPVEAYESLFFLNCGFSVEEILEAYDRVRGREIDTEDYRKAMDNLDSKRNHVFLPHNEIGRFLEDSLETWRIFLHQKQRKIVESDQSGPVLVLGGAGTGKTVVAMHRAKWLAETACHNGEKILFTTFNVNLAHDISNNMNKLCGRETMGIITVASIDKWVRAYLVDRNFHKSIEYWPKGIQLKNCFERALQMVPFAKTLDKDLLHREWANVFQPWDFKDATEYLHFRSTWDDLPSMERKNLLALYEFFDTYRNFLDQKGVVDFGGALLAATKLAEKEDPMFRTIVVDEAQDMRPGTWMLFRALAPKDKNDLFIVGDPAQRIGTTYSELSRCGIDVEGRIEHLRLNYRTTERIRAWASRLLEGNFVDDLNGGFDSQKGYHSERRGDSPVIAGFSSIDEELDFILTKIREFMSEGHPLEDMVLIVHHEKGLLPLYQSQLEERGVPVYPLPKQEIDDRKQEGLRMTIMHRVKGLEFENVFLAGISEDHVPPGWLLERKSGLELENFLEREKALLYVSATRAKTHLVVTWNGKPSPLLESQR